jgi:hypothetical protein
MIIGGFYRIENVRLKADRNRQGHEGSLGGEEKRITPILKDAPTLYLEKLLERRDGKRPQLPRTQYPPPGKEEKPIPTHPLRLDATTPSHPRIQSKPVTATAPNHTSDTTQAPTAKDLPHTHLHIVSNLIGAPRLVTPIASILKHGKCPALFQVHARIYQYEANTLGNSLSPYCESCSKWYLISIDANAGTNKTVRLQQDDINCGMCGSNATHKIKLLLTLKDDSGTILVNLTGLNAVSISLQRRTTEN